MQTAIQPTETVQILRKDLDAVATVWGSALAIEDQLAFTQFKLGPHCGYRVRTPSVSAATSTAQTITPDNQPEGAIRRNRSSDNAAKATTKPVRDTRARRGSWREAIISLLQSNTAGLGRGEILQHFNLKDDKSGAMVVSSALTAMIKRNQLRRDGGKYFYVTPTTQEQKQLETA